MPSSLLERVISRHGADGLTSKLNPRELAALQYCWPAWAREDQLPPDGEWLIWFLLGGRGGGKTRAGAEFVRAEVEGGRASRIALIAKTPADVRDVMVEGDSGFLKISPPQMMPLYEPSKRRLTWPNGAMALAFSSHEPDQLRGPQFDLAWCDELASWAYPRQTWDNLMFGLRIGARPHVAITTTPKPIKLLTELLTHPHCVISRCSSYDNRKFLAPSFFEHIIARYEGTTLGRQEIYAELLTEMEGALWIRANIRYASPPEDLERVVVAIDPAVTSGPDSDETGIIVAGRKEGKWYVLADLSGRFTPDAWARRAIMGLEQYHGDRIIGEVNNGGDMVEHTLRTISATMPYEAVHASRGKRSRAEPIAALYEQGKVSHAQPFELLEDQLCIWTSESRESPDRMDALVWALTALQQAVVGIRWL